MYNHVTGCKVTNYIPSMQNISCLFIAPLPIKSTTLSNETYCICSSNSYLCVYATHWKSAKNTMERVLKNTRKTK